MKTSLALFVSAAAVGVLSPNNGGLTVVALLLLAAAIATGARAVKS